MKKKILIVDDNMDMVKILTYFLSSREFDVRGAYRGDEGLTLARDFVPDLALLDVCMPGMSGHELCTSMKQDDKLKNIPIVFTTVEGEPEDISFGYSLGAEAYMVKPFHLSDLHDIIMSILENSL